MYLSALTPAAPASVVLSRPARSSLVAQLNREWEQLRHTPAPWLADSPDLETVLAGLNDDPDATLSSLITACQNGYPVAGRVIVQALLPKLVLVSRQYPCPSVDHLVAALWLRVARYPLPRRPRAIATNLVLDARKDAVAEVRTPSAPTLVPFTDDPEQLARAVINTARRLHLATEDSLTIVEHIYVDGLPSEQVAQLHALTLPALRRRCSDTVQRLRAHRTTLADFAFPA